MKINFIASNLGGGGAQRVMVTLANELCNRHHDITILTFNEPEDYELNKKIKRVRLHNGKIKNHTIRSFCALISHYKRKSNRPDLIISFLTLTNLKAIIVAKFYGIKIIASEHTHYARNTFRTDAFTKKYIYRLSDFVTVLTNYDVAYYKKYKSRVVVMPNPTTFKSGIGTTKEKKDNVILAVGALDRYELKGFDSLISLLVPVFKKHPNWKLNILGKGESGAVKLSTIIKENNLEKNVQLLGFQQDVQYYMRKSKIFVLSSKNEGLPMGLIEAMSQGMACIAYDCVTGPSDIINDGIDGILVEDQNKAKMTQGILKLIEDDVYRESLQNNAVKIVPRFSVENILAKWNQLFINLGLQE